MDLMLDIALFPQERVQVAEVEIIQNDNLEVIFRGQKSVVSRKEAVAPENRVGCQEGKFTIMRVREGVGEAVSATKTTINESLFLMDDGALVIETELLSRNRSLIFWWTSSEEYAASFRRLP